MILFLSDLNNIDFFVDRVNAFTSLLQIFYYTQKDVLKNFLQHGENFKAILDYFEYLRRHFNHKYSILSLHSNNNPDMLLYLDVFLISSRKIADVYNNPNGRYKYELFEDIMLIFSSKDERHIAEVKREIEKYYDEKGLVNVDELDDKSFIERLEYYWNSYDTKRIHISDEFSEYSMINGISEVNTIFKAVKAYINEIAKDTKSTHTCFERIDDENILRMLHIVSTDSRKIRGRNYIKKGINHDISITISFLLNEQDTIELVTRCLDFKLAYKFIKINRYRDRTE
jgi:hypothetical protein